LGLLIVARPLLIDFQYGQVNTFILGASVWALVSHFDSKGSIARAACAWALISAVALAKLFPMPLLLVPFFVSAGLPREKLRVERGAIMAGLAIIALVPVVTQGFSGALNLYFHWNAALMAKGLPTESHNQSFAALLHHYFGGGLTHVIAAGSQHIPLGSGWLSEQKIEFISAGWILATFGWMIGWILVGPKRPLLTWIAVLIGMLVVPSHLVWKPYFVMGLPAAALACHYALQHFSLSQGFMLFLVFAGMNFTGYDFVGRFLAARLEAASIFLVLHLCLVLFVIRKSRNRFG
jgi:hypothetical protein